MSDHVRAHPRKVAVEVASLAPSGEVTIRSWKDSWERMAEVVEHAGRYLEAHEPVGAGAAHAEALHLRSVTPPWTSAGR